MAEVISLTILPQDPVLGKTFYDYLLGATVEVYDIHIDDFLPGHRNSRLAPSTIYN